MKLVRYGALGAEKPAILDAKGVLRDLSVHVGDVSARVLAPDVLEKLGEVDPAQLPAVQGSPRLGVPVSGVGKFIGIGLNFADHAKESGLEPPPEPIFFMKAISCLNGPNAHEHSLQSSKSSRWQRPLARNIRQ